MVNNRKWNPKAVLFLGGALSLGGIFISSFMTNFYAFVFFYGALSGVGCGINYFVPLICSWEHFPEKKGLITGIMVGSYGLGSFIYTQISTKIVNPLNEDVYPTGHGDIKYFHENVSRRVPYMFRILDLVWAC